MNNANYFPKSIDEMVGNMIAAIKRGLREKYTTRQNSEGFEKDEQDAFSEDLKQPNPKN